MNFEDSLEKVISCNSNLNVILSESDAINQDIFSDLINQINKIFTEKAFNSKFNEEILRIEMCEENMFLNSLIENLTVYVNYISQNFDIIQAHNGETLNSIKNTIKTIELISEFDLTKQLVLLNGGVLVAILEFLENENINFALNTNNILGISLNLSKHNYYGKLDFSTDCPLEVALASLDRIKLNENLDAAGCEIVENMQKTLMSDSIEACLKRFQSILNNHGIKKLLEEKTFFDGLRMLSTLLNNESNMFFYWDLFKK